MDNGWLLDMGLMPLLVLPSAGESSEGSDDSEFSEHIAGGFFFSNMKSWNHV